MNILINIVFFLGVSALTTSLKAESPQANPIPFKGPYIGLAGGVSTEWFINAVPTYGIHGGYDYFYNRLLLGVEAKVYHINNGHWLFSEAKDHVGIGLGARIGVLVTPHTAIYARLGAEANHWRTHINIGWLNLRSSYWHTSIVPGLGIETFVSNNTKLGFEISHVPNPFGGYGADATNVFTARISFTW